MKRKNKWIAMLLTAALSLGNAAPAWAEELADELLIEEETETAEWPGETDAKAEPEEAGLIIEEIMETEGAGASEAKLSDLQEMTGDDFPEFETDAIEELVTTAETAAETETEVMTEAETAVKTETEVMTEAETTAETETEVMTEAETTAETEMEEETETLLEGLAGDEEPPAGFVEECETVELAEAEAAASISGETCGDNLVWSFEEGTLTISGTGEMEDYSETTAPWSGLNIISLIIESGVTGISDQAFAECSYLQNISLPDTLTSIGSGAFYGCRNLESVVLPAGVKELVSGVFANCTSLESLTAPGLTTIREYALQGITADTFTIPAGVSLIEPMAFYGAEIGTFNVESGNRSFSASDGVLFADGGTKLLVYPGGKQDSSYTIPSTVTTVADSAFLKAEYLEQIEIPSSVTTLGSSAFQGCTSLQSVVLPDSVSSAGMFTFYKCSNLKSVKFGRGLSETSYEMFESCESLETIDFGDSLQSLEARTFAYCSSLTEVTLPANITSIGNGTFGECQALESFTSRGLQTIPYQAFCNDYSLARVTLNEGVKDINRCAFQGCTGLLSIVLPASVTYVHSMAFESCTVISCLNPALEHYGANGMRTLEALTVSGTRDYKKAFSVLKIVNQKRAEEGAAPLVMEASLLESAMQRAAETAVLFSHTRPDGSSCFDLNSLMTGENVAFGSSTPDGVMTQWMNSEGHRANILNSEFKTIGIGCMEIDGSWYWTQCFGTGDDTADCAVPENRKETTNVRIATETFNEAEITSGVIFGTADSYTYTTVLRFSDKSLKKGETTTAVCYLINPGSDGLSFRIEPQDLLWTSSDSSVAEVSNGVVTARKDGSVKISATMRNGFYKAEAALTVKSEKPSSEKDEKDPQKKELTVTLGKTSYVYTGKAIKPSVTVQCSGANLKTGQYSVKYKNNKNTGIATVTVTGKGSYAGSSGKAVFQILPRKVSVSSLKSKGRKKMTVKWKKVTEASGYQIQYGTSGKFKNADTKKVKGASVVSKTLNKLKSGKTYYVRIRACKEVSGDTLYGDWSAVRKVKVR